MLTGGSAGGYTTLAALAFKKTFLAGASLYGVADLKLLREETHKFESRYMDNLVGGVKEFFERSPINFVDQFSCPIILFQGLKDKVLEACLLYQVGLKGESLGLHTGASTLWVSGSPKSQPLTWYRTNFDAPSGDNPIAIAFTGMGKGEAWVNGQSIRRYWTTHIAPTTGCQECSYKGSSSPTKCLKNCGEPSQKLYHVPRSWLKSSGNILVLSEEKGGDPTQIAFATQELESVCSQVSESHPLPMEAWSQDKSKSKPSVSLECPHPNQVISSIKFAIKGHVETTVMVNA
ncbi:putative beta-galactosidase [Helianthus debilis subsp. tardiflorus]